MSSQPSSASAPAPACGFFSDWPRVGKIPPHVSQILDFSRWVAAGFVVLNHLRAILFADFTHIENPGLLLKGFFFVSGFGFQAVMIFFVLSGYLVGGEIVRSLQDGSFALGRYGVTRFARLYAVYPVALLLGGFFDWLGSTHFNASGLYTQPTGVVIQDAIVNHLNMSTLLGNLAFLQTTFVHCFGSNDPLWSLAYEAWYYVLFPLLGMVFLRPHSPYRLGALALFLALGWLGGKTLMLYFGIWLLGLLPRLLHRALIPSVTLTAALTLALACVARLSSPSEGIRLLQCGSLALAFALFLNTHEFHGGAARGKIAAFHQDMARFSYSLYVLHWPAIVLALALVQQTWGFGIRATRPTPALALLFSALVLMVYGYAWIVSRFTERHTPALRRRLLLFFGLEAAPAKG